MTKSNSLNLELSGFGLSFEITDTIEISKADNGYAVKEYIYEDDNDDGNKIITTNITLFKFENDEEEKKELANLLYFLAEKLGHGYDKWEEDNLNISWDKKGSKVNYEDEN